MTLDDIRREIANRYERAVIDSRVADQQMALAKAELEAHDRAVAAMPPAFDLSIKSVRSPRAPRRDIAALVREALTAEPQTVAQVAEKVGVAPSRALPALNKVGKLVDDPSDGWVRK